MATHSVHTCLETEQVQAYKAVLCDLDGCLITGGAALPGAQEFTAAVADRLWIVSNNSSDTAGTLSETLDRLGICVPEAQILLAGEYAVGQLALSNPGARVRCLTDGPVREKAEDAGLQLIHGQVPLRQAEYVLLGRMAVCDLKCLEAAIADLAAGAKLLVTNTDKTHPGASGLPVPETGAWLAAFEACLPGLTYKSYGKPEPGLLAKALESSGTEANDAVFVGDNPETDGKAAAIMGMDFIEINRLGGADPAEKANGHLLTATAPC